MCDDPLIDNATFEAALQARYQRLSLLTLDLAQEAGEGVQDFARVDLGTSTGRFDHGIAAMTKAIWAHSVIERLRGGEVPSLSLSGGLFPHGKTPHGSHHRGAPSVPLSNAQQTDAAGSRGDLAGDGTQALKRGSHCQAETPSMEKGSGQKISDSKRPVDRDHPARALERRVAQGPAHYPVDDGTSRGPPP